MSATDFLYPRFPIQGADIPVKNTSGTAWTVGQLLKMDSANVVSATQPQIGAIITAAVTDIPFGFAIEATPASGQGRCQIAGIMYGLGVAAGVTAGATVGPSGSVSGQIVAYTATDPYAGQALTAGVSAADPVLVHIMPGITA
jgi:hypothetical protein